MRDDEDVTVDDTQPTQRADFERDHPTLVDQEAPRLAVPWSALSADAQAGVLEEFVTREGTEYGEREVSLDEKVASVRAQLERGDAFVLFDGRSGTTQVATRRELAELGVPTPD